MAQDVLRCPGLLLCSMGQLFHGFKRGRERRAERGQRLDNAYLRYPWRTSPTLASILNSGMGLLAHGVDHPGESHVAGLGGAGWPARVPVSHHGKAASLLAGTGRLNGGVQPRRLVWSDSSRMVSTLPAILSERCCLALTSRAEAATASDKRPPHRGQHRPPAHGHVSANATAFRPGCGYAGRSATL